MGISEEITLAIERMEPISPSAIQLLTLIRDRDHSVTDVVRIVQADATLTARVLRAVNSAAFGRANRVDTLDRAIALLGDRNVMAMAWQIHAANLYRRPLRGYRADEDALWHHSLYTAIATREIASTAREPVAGAVGYTAGLLHDIGKAVIDDWLATREGLVSERLDSGGEDFDEAERSRLQTDHAEAGAGLLRHWGLPETLVEPIAHHHAPGQAGAVHRTIAYAVHLGDALAMMAGVGTGIDTLHYSLDPGYEDCIRLDTAGLERLSLRVTDEFQRTAAALHEGMDASRPG